jgi:hypothetical protein
MKYEETLLISAHKHSIFHKKEILESRVCGCFYCIKMFHPSQIKEWVDNDKSEENTAALCPFCGIDSVIGDKSGVPLLSTIRFLKK